MITIYGIKNCDTMQKAFKWLDANKIKYAFHDYKKSGLTKEIIAEWLKQLSLDQLINTRGTTWKNLTETEKASISNVNKAVELMMENSSMIKRPLVDTGNGYLLGFDALKWKTQL
jgi:arsenate reductase